jgi:type I restriction enzyme S subunit
MEGWKQVKLKVVAKIIGGYAFKSKDFTSEGDVPVVKIKNLKNKNLIIDSGDYISNDFLELDQKYHINFNDILIALTGSHITLPSSAVGRVAKSRHHKKLLLNQRVGKFLINPKLCNHDFLYYLLTTDYFFQSVGLRAKGAANQANISGGDVGNIIINLPPLPTQYKIASILSAYDDLIENNLKRIKLLEEKAQLTYEEWFVRMKYPGHEADVMDEETGLPEGWEKVYFKGNINFKTGKLDSNALVENGEFDFYTCAKEVYSTNTFCFEGEAVLLGGNNATGNFALFYANSKFDAYQRTYIVTPVKDSTPLVYIYFYLRKLLPYFQIVSSGAATKFLTMKILNKTKIILPKAQTLKEFKLLIKPTFDLVLQMKNQNQLLKEARDILLPRLMTGMIDVDEIEGVSIVDPN